ncbi:MAG: DUF1735 domain-containing protein [Bacteroidota bacterium]
MKRIILLMMMAVTVSLTACVKDNAVNLAPGASPPVVEWETATIQDAPTNAATNIYRTYARSFEIVAAVKQDFKIDLTGTDPASSDVTVGVGVKAQAVTDYNTKYGTTYTLLPANMYTMPASVVIPKGGRSATVSIVINATLFDLTKTYVLPLTITSTTAGGISGNYGTVIYTVSAKNKYDGIYTVNGTMTDYVAGSGLTGKYPIKYYLITTGPSSVALYDYTVYNNYAHQILSGGTTTSSFGTFSPIFTFDGSNNVTSVVNYYGQPAAAPNLRSAGIDATGTNKYTSGLPGAAGSVFQCSYFLFQGNLPSAGPGGARDGFNETFTYVGPRP